MNIKVANAGREVMAALILLAAVSLFIDFRVGGGNRTQVENNATRVGSLEKTAEVGDLKDSSQVDSIEELTAEIEELRIIVGTLLEERNRAQSLEPPKENLDTPLKEGSK